MIKYHNVYDSEGNIVEIKQVTLQNRTSMQFFCIGCDAEMEAVLGQKKQHHFRHKDKGNCSPETYYHRLAKRILKCRFETLPQFLVKYYVRNECPKSTKCELKKRYNWKDCSSVVLKTVNLKDYFDTCEEEVYYKGFKADLMLTHSEYSDRKPVFLEVAVTHDCTQEKINSKIRIIETKVQNEVDAFREIIENEGEFINESGIIKPNDNEFPPIRFYNFKRESKDDGFHPLSRFYLFHNKYGICQALCKSKVVNCTDINLGHKNNSLFGVTISEEDIPIGCEYDLYDLGIALTNERGLDVRSCILCQYFKRSNSLAQRFGWASRCVTNKMSQLPKNEKFHFAWECSYYRCDDNQRKHIIDSFKSIPYDEWINNKKIITMMSSL